MPSLPPLRPRSGLRRLVARVNLFRMPSLERRRALSAYWHNTERYWRERRVWRLNPLTFAWNAARDIKNAVIFFSALSSERY
jgi:hypothetical protein